MTDPGIAGRSHRNAPTVRYDPTYEELAELLDGEPRYRVDQVWDGLHQRGDEIEDLSNVPKSLRAWLAGKLPLALTPELESISDDGETVKWRAAGSSDRDRPHALPRSNDGLRVLTSRVRHGMRILCNRSVGVRPSSLRR